MVGFQVAGLSEYAALSRAGGVMRRRDFLGLLGGSATAVWPLVARAQQSGIPVVGFLNSSSEQAQRVVASAYRRGLEQTGFVEGKNVLLEYRWADGQYARLPDLVASLIGRKVAVIMAGGPPAAQAAKKATSTIPIVFTSGDDPVQIGLVSSINRPDANVTGVYVFFAELQAKKLGLLRELVPNAGVIAFLINPAFPSASTQTQGIREAADKLGQKIQIIAASSPREIDAAFASMVQSRTSALVVATDVFFNTRREQIISLAAKYAIPAAYEQRASAVAGGLMSYGTNLSEGYRQAGLYTGRILKGEKPGNLPVVLSNTFEFVINLKVAKALGLKVSPNVLSTADEVIE
jgi:putative ABC transport system substrate-binding protein